MKKSLNFIQSLILCFLFVVGIVFIEWLIAHTMFFNLHFSAFTSQFTAHLITLALVLIGCWGINRIFLLSPFFRFLLVGLVIMFSDWIMTQVMISILHFTPFIAHLISLVVILIGSWIANRTFTFKTKNKKSIKEFILYAFGDLSGAALNMLVFTIIVHLAPQVVHHVILATGPALVCSFFYTFFYLKWLYKH